MDENETPLKLVQLSDFLRCPSIISKNFQLKPSEYTQTPQDYQQGLASLEHPKRDELIIPKDIIVFADESERKQLGITDKSRNVFSRHLLITCGAALQALIPSLTNAKQWIMIFNLKFIKRYTTLMPIQENVVVSLNINHPLVRYEILTGLDLLQQSFNEAKSAFIVMDFCRLLRRWFKNSLKRTNQYPSLPNRLLYRYEIETSKCSITIGKRHANYTNKKSDDPIQIYIDFNSLPTLAYSIQSENIFIYSMNDRYKQIVKEIGNGLSLVSIENIRSTEEQIQKTKPIEQRKEMALVPFKQDKQDKQQSNSSPMEKFEVNHDERILFDKICDNRMRIEMQHQQLMSKAARLLSFSTIQNN